MKNRILKTPVILATVALLTAGGALAGPPDHDGSWRMGPPGPEQRLARLARGLDLNPEQSRQMLEVLQAAEADHQAIRTRFFEEVGPELCAIRRNMEADILALLTAEQAARFLEHKEEGPGRQAQRRQGTGAMLDCQAYDD
jgi:Spy/CpxP family protein refolding chaperone